MTQAKRLADEWLVHARLAQLPPRGDWTTWLIIGGRGSGKTRAGAEWVNGLVRGLRPFSDRPLRRLALVGETIGDVREVMIDGPSGLRSVARGDGPVFEAGRRRLVWPNGAIAQVFSAQEPDSLRGPQFEAAWCDAKTIWASLITITSGLANLSGLPVPGINAVAASEQILHVVTAISGAVALAGRVTATARLR